MNVLKILGINAFTHEKDSKNYMDSEQKIHFKRILRAWKDHISTSCDDSKNTLTQEIKAFSDLSDRASYEEELSLIFKRQSRDGKLISRIEKSMRTLENGTYGFCELCDAEIGIKRLEARPVAKLCIDCKSLSEEVECL